jgi:hypothetical protein
MDDDNGSTPSSLSIPQKKEGNGKRERERKKTATASRRK